MVALTVASNTNVIGNLRVYHINEDNTSIIANGSGVLRTLIVTASSSGTLLFADDDVALQPAALAIAAGDILQLNLPYRGGLTITAGGTSYTASVVVEEHDDR